MNNTQRESEEIKKDVQDKYAQISQSKRNKAIDSCCSGESCGSAGAHFAEDYSRLGGYEAEADLGLGCGLPTEFAHIEEGDTVVDLGSGAGNDCFVARKEAGPSGRVIGLDMTREMNEKARRNAQKLGFDNVEFIHGDIEEIPLDDKTADVVVSNCVMNLVPDKRQAFAETYRIIKEGGHFSISDIVTRGELPEALREDAAMYAGCVAGVIDKREYLAVIREAGFHNITIQKEREIHLPDELLSRYLARNELERFRKSGVGIYSVTVYGEK